MDNYGLLYVCATPIGNLGDITLRALEILRSVDCIAAEDTRRTLKLLNHYGIKNRLISCHEHNEKQKCDELICLLKAGASVAYVSDAGMPVVSDPGGHLVSRCIEEGIGVTVCPGASAVVTALVLSGFQAEKFVFEGFLPRSRRERLSALEELKHEKRLIILYEAPHRLIKTLADIQDILGDRKIAICRELTKVHEEVIRSSVSECRTLFEARDVKGELVLVIEGAAGSAENPLNSLEVAEHVAYYVDGGLNEMDAIKKAAKDRGVGKREVYEAVKCRT